MDKQPAEKPQAPKPAAPKPAAPPAQGKDFRHLVRISNTDLDGNKPLLMSLRRIKGISFMYANALCHTTRIPRDRKTGELSESEIAKLEDALHNPAKFSIPVWMRNRRKEYETGEDQHIITADLTYAVDNDIKRMKKIKSYKGIRHMIGQPVRGQRTKSNFRKNKGKISLGVIRKKTASPADGGDKKK